MVSGSMRYDIINDFINRRNYTSYLEIGTDRGQSLRAVQCEHKTSVDPNPSSPASYHLTSDEFFNQCHDSFDIIFIDGLHECKQVYRDIVNAISHLNKNGVIVLHDCLPTSDKMQEHHNESQYGYPWTGDVWKAFVKARTDLPYEMYTIMTDMGCGIIDTTLPKKTSTTKLPRDMDQMTYHDYTDNLGLWMNVKGAIQYDR